MKGLTSDMFAWLREEWERFEKEGCPGFDPELIELLKDFNQVPGVVTMYSCIGHSGNCCSRPYITFGVLGNRTPRVLEELLPEIFVSGILTLEVGLVISPMDDNNYLMLEDQLEDAIPAMTIRGLSIDGDPEVDKTARELFVSNIQSIIMKLDAAFNS